MLKNGSVRQGGAVRLELVGPIFAAVENWRRSLDEIPSRTEAVRLLLALGLRTANSPRPPHMRRLMTGSRVTTKTVPATSPT
jgi:hypothetical protein